MQLRRLTSAKIKRKIWGTLLPHLRKSGMSFYAYKSYWHYRLSGSRPNYNNENLKFLTGTPNPGAGIGHQLANWIAGYWFAAYFKISYAYSAFPSETWDSFLSFGKDEVNSDKLLLKGYQKVLIPLFNEDNKDEVNLIKKIISSYKSKKVIFFLEQDQFHKDLHKVGDLIKKKFHTGDARKNNKLMYSPDNFNIAVHIRRGDIITHGKTFSSRKQENSYFLKIVSDIKTYLKTEKPKVFHLFSDGEESDFEEFRTMTDFKFCLSSNAKESFLHMAFADLLVTSKSSFSYKPALLNHGLKICPRNFWHGYPATNDFLLADDFGELDINGLINYSQK